MHKLAITALFIAINITPTYAAEALFLEFWEHVVREEIISAAVALAATENPPSQPGDQDIPDVRDHCSIS